ncbi:MAG: hypothetical protein ACLFTK_06020 [Anaerolineales bacterium]
MKTLDDIFDKLNGPEDNLPQDDDDGLTPAQQTVLAYIRQNSNITQAELQDEVTSLTPDQVAQALTTLMAAEMIVEEKLRGGSVYRAITRHRARRRGTSMHQVWGALDDGQRPQREAINPEARRTRSALTDNIFARLDEAPPQAADPPDSAATSSQNDRSLMADLAKAGQSSMRKRGIPDTARQQPPAGTEKTTTSASGETDGDDLMRALSDTGRKTQQYNAAQLKNADKDDKPEAKKGLLGRLRGWLSDD